MPADSGYPAYLAARMASFYEAIRTHRPLNSSSIRPSHQDSFLCTHFFRTHYPLYLILYTNYQWWGLHICK
jgi:hypothetical protein